MILVSKKEKKKGKRTHQLSSRQEVAHGEIKHGLSVTRDKKAERMHTFVGCEDRRSCRLLGVTEMRGVLLVLDSISMSRVTGVLSSVISR